MSDRVCRVCDQEKNLIDFNFYNRKYWSIKAQQWRVYTNVSTVCKSCDSDKSHTYYLNNSNAIKTRVKAYDLANDYIVKYRKKNADKLREYNSQYKKTHRDAIRIRNNNREALVRGAKGKYTKAEWQELCKRFDHRCLRCGNTSELSVDHVIPVTKGGSNSIENIQPLCRSCNSSKGNRSNVDYRLAASICIPLLKLLRED